MKAKRPFPKAPSSLNPAARGAAASGLGRFILPLALGLSALLGFLFPVNLRLENTLNMAFARPLDSRLLVVAIDDASLRDYGRMDAWPRELYASALQTLQEAGVKAVGLDVLLSAPTGNDAALAALFSQPNLVLATSPEDALSPFPADWHSPTGVSALNAPQVANIREVQTAYPLQGSAVLTPSFARQVAAQLGPALPLSTQPYLLRYSRPEQVSAHTLSFRDVVNGNIRFADVQGKVVIIGLSASSGGGLRLPDIDGRPVPGSLLQARAVSTLLAPPFVRIPGWLVAALTALLAGLAVWARGLWGFGIAALCLLAAIPLWLGNIIVPGVTLSLGALVGVSLVALERWWAMRRAVSQDALTGLGNRLAFTRIVEDRWQHRQERPITLLLIDLDHFRRVNELYGRHTGDAVLNELARRLQTLRQRGDMIFRWGPDEFAVLLDPSQGGSLNASLDLYRQNLSEFEWQDITLQANVGGASTTPEIHTAADLIEAASRERYRMKYLREQANDYGLNS